MTKTVTIGSKGQITLPKALRDKYHLEEGETVVILDSGDGIFVKHGGAAIRGILRSKIDSAGFEKDLRKLRKAWTR